MGLFNRKPRVDLLAKNTDLGGLTEALSYKDKDVRKDAAMFIQELISTGGPDRINIMVNQLRKDPEIVKRIIAASKDENETIRWCAVRSMGFLQVIDGQLLEPIIAALEDRDRQVRTCAALALGFSKKIEAIEPLIDASYKETDPPSVKAISEALQKLFTLHKDAKKGNSRVGPILYVLWEKVSPGNRTEFKKFLSSVPSGCEIAASYKNAPVETAQTILSAFQKTGLPGHGVIGAQVLGDDFVIYVKGNFPKDAFDPLVQAFKQSGKEFGLKVEVENGRFDPKYLTELP